MFQRVASNNKEIKGHGVFSNLSHLSEEIIDIDEEEYQWVKKRNAKLKKNQNNNTNSSSSITSLTNKENNNKENKENQENNKENESITIKINSFLSPKKEILNEINENFMFSSPSKNEESTTFKKQGLQRKEEFKERKSSKEEQEVSNVVMSPEIQRTFSKLSIQSFSADSKDSSPFPTSRSEKYSILQEKEEISITPKPLSSKKAKKEKKDIDDKEIASFIPLLESCSDSDGEQEEEVVAGRTTLSRAEAEKLEQEMFVEQFFSKVRHNRQQQVIQTLKSGFNVNLTVFLFQFSSISHSILRN